MGTKDTPEPKTIADYMAVMKSMKRWIDEMRLAIVYLKFDVEATRRERDAWRKKAEGKNYGKGKNIG
jgi:hypothetical protein